MYKIGSTIRNRTKLYDVLSKMWNVIKKDVYDNIMSLNTWYCEYNLKCKQKKNDVWIVSETWNVIKFILLWNSIKLYDILITTWNPIILYNCLRITWDVRILYDIVNVTNPNNLCRWICFLYDWLFPCSLIGRYPAFPIKI